MKNTNKIESITNQINSQNAIILEGAISVLSALSSDCFRVLKIILKRGIETENKNAAKIIAAAKMKNIEIEIFSADEMKEFTEIYSDITGRTHGGIIAVSLKREFLSVRELLSKLPKNPARASVAIIEGIEDPYNLGYAARALYTQGIDALILPERDFGFSESIIEKASTGTFSKMPAAVFSNSNLKEFSTNGASGSPRPTKIDIINLLKSEKFKIYCIDKKIPAGSKLNLTHKII